MARILIIEDDLSFAATLARRLTKHQHQCQHTDLGHQALLMSRDFLPEVILLDMKLHNESGLKLIPLLRTILPNCNIILITGFASIATAVDAIKLGANEYLPKPLDTQTLLSAIAGKSVPTVEDIDDEPLSVEQMEWEHINQALKFNDGNVSATARQLNMHRRTLQRKLAKKPSFNKEK